MFIIIASIIIAATLAASIICNIVADEKWRAIGGILSFVGGVAFIVVFCFSGIHAWWHVVVGVIFAVAPAFISLIGIMEHEGKGCVSLISVLVLLIAALLALWVTAEANHSKAFVRMPAEEEIISYKLVAASHDSQIEGSVSGNRSYHVTKVNGKVGEEDFFRFYYESDPETGEITFKKVLASEIKIFFVEDGETPCYEVTIRREMEVNEITGETRISETEVLSLRIPKGAIEEVYDLNP